MAGNILADQRPHLVMLLLPAHHAQCKYNRLPIHLFVSGCAAPSMWDAALPAYGHGVRYTPWIFTLVLNNQDKGNKVEGGTAGTALSELRQQALLEQLQGCDKLPRHLRQPDKVCTRDGSAPVDVLSFWDRRGRSSHPRGPRLCRFSAMVNTAAAAAAASCRFTGCARGHQDADA